MIKWPFKWPFASKQEPKPETISLHFGVDTPENASIFREYAAKKREVISREQALNIINNSRFENKSPVVYIDTKLDNCNKHIMVLDCDDEEGMIAAMRYLYIKEIGTCAIESSNKRYWVVTDFISDIKSVIKEMKPIPGHDVLHREYSNAMEYISIRAFLKNDDVLPKFPNDYHRLTNKLSKAWMDELRKWYVEVDKATKLGALRRIYSTEKLNEACSDPDFVI